MNMMHAISAMLGATARNWSGMSIPRHQAHPRPRYGNVKRQQRAAAKRRARRRAKRLNHY